jgi:hypothetical protein
VSTIAELYRRNIIEPDKQALFLLLVAFVVTFLFIRLSVRMIRAGVSWWPGNVQPGGLHIHHVVFGLAFMLIGGVFAFAPAGWESPWWEILAVLFGIGAALVLDEFALVLHLDDVYWSEKGRLSVDAVALGAALTGMLLLGALPFGVDELSRAEQATRWQYVGTILVNGVLVITALLKARIWLGILGVLFPVLALIGTIRLAKPDSLWARWWYAPGSRKLLKATARADRRDARWTRAKHRVFDAIAGRPNSEQASERTMVPDQRSPDDHIS